MKVEVITVKVKPATVQKLQADVVVLKQDSIDKQVIIDKLQTDLIAQQQTSTALEQRIENLEGLNP